LLHVAAALAAGPRHGWQAGAGGHVQLPAEARTMVLIHLLSLLTMALVAFDCICILSQPAMRV